MEVAAIPHDLIGMGDSEKLEESGPDRYTFAEHYQYFDAALEEAVSLLSGRWGRYPCRRISADALF